MTCLNFNQKNTLNSIETDPKGKVMKVLETEIPKGKESVVYLKVANLPTRTEIDIPVFIYRSHQPGPCVLFSAGMHGDEINGVEIIRRILDCNLNFVERGTTICIPIINVYGFLHFSRNVPDGKDVNRSFPGFKDGSLASKVAWNIMHHILPLIDFGIDFHTGGDQRANYPQVRGDFSDTNVLDLAQKTHAPFLVNSSLIHRSFRQAAYDLGKKIIVYEGGESLRFSYHAIEEGVMCAQHFLYENQMIPQAPKIKHQSKTLTNRSWYRAPASGMWIAEIHEGDFVNKNQSLGYITSPYGDFIEKVVAEEDGFIIGLNKQAVVNNGEALINLGSIS
ncbi:Ectoine utilization protein EutE [Candidatus Ornithobacterium hominis]|nr:Ectoine utilization protein EutE [Candidatus Ornithobacterium hominis]